MDISKERKGKQMYFNILRKDLKKKKTMNIILLLFTILAAMFVSSGLSNVITVMNGTDYYLDKAGVGDYVVITMGKDNSMTNIIEKSKNVESYRVDDCYWGSREQIKVNGKDPVMSNNNMVLQKICDDGIKFFDSDNELLDKVKAGQVYVTAGFLKDNDAKTGDVLEIDYHGTKKKYEIAGEMKDALLGSDMMGNTRFILSEDDMSAFEKTENDPYIGHIYYIDTTDEKALVSELSEAENVLFSGGRSMIKMTYVMEMIVAMIVLVMSVCLCIVSFVLLKFVITFTINEEFREIGVMKAIGIRNIKIRSIYLVKYFAMSLMGGIVGLIAGIPFGNLLIASVSEKMVLSNDFGTGLNIAGAVVVVLIMTGFAYLCTGKVKKSTPVDAIRSGATGERYGKKSKYSLKKSHFGNAFYMALNDVLSSPKRFKTIILSFFICSIFVFGVVEVTDTMLSDKLITTFGKKSDVYITSDKFTKMEMISESGNRELEELIKGVENDLDQLKMPGSCSVEVWYKYPVEFEDTSISVRFQQNKYTKASDYEYTEGSAPQNADEVAITDIIANKLDAHIGDTITIDFGTEKRECMVVAYFQTMNQMGEIIRLHEDAPTDMIYANAFMGVQIDFDDHPDNKVISDRIEKLKDFYDTEDVLDAAGYCDDCMGVAATMDAVAKLLLAITCIVVILVTVLMERSFISDETSQIALLKAIGFRDSFVIKWQIYRFLIVSVTAELLAIALTHPVTRLWCDPIWKMMGASNVDYNFNPVSLMIVYPGIILTINLIFVWITAGITRKITCNDVGNVE